MKYKLSTLIEQVSVKCGVENHDNISGINIQKRFMPSKNSGSNTSNYKMVYHNQFACNLMHVGRDEKIPIALNDDNREIVVSPAYTVFRVIDTSVVDIDYLNMIFTSSEFDRYAWFCTDASIRGNLDWERFLDIEIDLPPLHIQEKYVSVYKSMLYNQKAYETGLEDLKLVCDATIEKLRREMPSEAIGKYIERQNRRNIDNKNKHVLGLSTKKEFREPSSKVDKSKLSNYKIVEENWFAYVPTTDTWKVFAFGLNKKDGQIIVSPIYEVFSVIDDTKLRPEYLAMWFKREEFDRFVRFHSWGSARENFNYTDLEEVTIPIPDIEIQQSIVDIYTAYITRNEINEKLKQQIKDICPILIAGAIKEANANG